MDLTTLVAKEALAATGITGSRTSPTRKPRRSGFSREDITDAAISVSDLPPSRLNPVPRDYTHHRPTRITDAAISVSGLPPSRLKPVLRGYTATDPHANLVGAASAARGITDAAISVSDLPLSRLKPVLRGYTATDPHANHVGAASAAGTLQTLRYLYLVCRPPG
jgi:hypothetical protein